MPRVNEGERAARWSAPAHGDKTRELGTCRLLSNTMRAYSEHSFTILSQVTPTYPPLWSLRNMACYYRWWQQRPFSRLLRRGGWCRRHGAWGTGAPQRTIAVHRSECSSGRKNYVRGRWGAGGFRLPPHARGDDIPVAGSNHVHSLLNESDGLDLFFLTAHTEYVTEWYLPWYSRSLFSLRTCLVRCARHNVCTLVGNCIRCALVMGRSVKPLAGRPLPQ